MGRRFTSKRAKPVVTVGLIYASWCGHCQALKPEWKKMKKGKKCHFIEIEDSDRQKDLKIANINKRLIGEKLSVSGFPTIFKIKGGKIEYYQGERSAGAMQTWISGGSNEVPELVPSMMQRMFGGCGCNSGKIM